MPLVIDEVAVDALAESLSISDPTARAALLLDEVAPGWTDNIDLDALNMSSITNCILGQLRGTHPYFGACGDWTDALWLLGDAIGSRHDIDSTILYNFSSGGEEWIALILARRALVGA